MVSAWRPDSCNCIIIYDKDFNVLESYKNQKTIPCSEHEELKGQDLLNFVIPENQATNEFYINWTEEEIKKSESMELIDEYKKVFIEVRDLEPIRELNLTDSIKEFRG